jgi:peptidoglycan/LPS O-acetylase OafA/YrhL
MSHHLWVYQGKLGQLGMRFFFVLSGYLITSILLGSRAKAEAAGLGQLPSIGRFYVRRFLRIFPLYYGVVLIAVAMNIQPARELAVWLLSYLLNFKMAAAESYPDRFAHLWSLSVEEQFYLVWPWLITFLPRKYLKPGLLGVASIAVIMRVAYIESGYTLVSGLGTYVLPFFQVDSLALGGFMAVTATTHSMEKITRGLKWLSVPAIVCIAILNLPFPQLGWPRFLVQETLASVVFCGLVWLGMTKEDGLTGKILSSKPLLYLGKISYGMYVLHPLSLVMLRWFYVQVHIPSAAPYGFTTFVICTAITVALSTVSWYAYERPINSLKRYFEGPKKKLVLDAPLVEAA